MKERLLLVEDDPEIARVIQDTLKREGYVVTWATTGLEGWEDFKHAAYDLVIVDLMLPEMDGYDLCKNIRLASDVPIMMISARHSPDDKVEGLKQGADDYLVKPFSLAELKARVESLLRRWRRYQGLPDEEQKVSYSGGLTIDWKREQAFLNNTEILLTGKEFDLLKVLAQNPHHIFSKEALYRHVWQQADQYGLATVTVHIKSLREKLNDSVKNPLYIETVWGKGYRFIGEEL